MQDFDFENWSDLHSSDPAEFERRREQALQEFIEQANPDSRLMLEQTLFTLQMHKQKAKSPLQSAIFASNLMWESFGKLRTTMDEARSVFEEARPSLSVVRGSQMSQIDNIINGWAAGAPVGQPGKMLGDADVETEGASSAQAVEGPARTRPAANGSNGGARIIAFPGRRQA